MAVSVSILPLARTSATTYRRTMWALTAFEICVKVLRFDATLLERLSNFNILSARFRHGKTSADKMELHRMAVDCVAFLVHHDLKYHPLMDI